MKKLYTEKAKRSMIERITQLIEVIGTAPGNIISYNDAHAITDILADYKEELEKDLQGNSQKA